MKAISVIFHKYNSLRKCMQQAIVEAIAPQLSHNTKKAFKIAKKMYKRVQAKNGDVLTTLEMLKDFKKKPRHGKQKKKKKRKISRKQLATFNVHCGKHIQRRTRGLYSTHVR